jgi:Flp pilus assembly protein TadG
MKHRKGAMLVLIAVTMVGLMALLALAIDGGSVQQTRRRAQNAADAGALAGAWEIYRNNNVDATVFSAALAEAARNGFTDGANHITVVATRPVSPDHFTGSAYVKVVVTDTVYAAFAAIINQAKIVVRATSFGGTVPPGTDCIVSLSPSAQKAIEIKNTGTTINAHNCGIKVNSTDPDALDLSSNAVLDAAGGNIGVRGGYTNSGTMTPLPQTGIAGVVDPLVGMAQPTGFSHTCDAAHTNVVINSGTVNLTAGVYCGGIIVQSAATAILGPGLYVLLGGGLQVKNNDTVLRSSSPGVAFFNTWDASNAYKRIDIEAGCHVDLTADPGGTLPGVLFFQDRTVTGNAGLLAGDPNNFQSDATSTYSGTLYFPTQDVEFQSGSTTTITNGGVIARQLLIQSGTTLNFPNGGGGGGGNLALRRASVIE